VNVETLKLVIFSVMRGCVQ